MDDPNMTMEEYIKLEKKKLIDVDTLPCKSQVSTPINDEFKFRISFDESEDEDYAIICDKNPFSNKMIYVNNLKTDSENDNEKAGIPSFPPPKPTTSYVDDLDFFKDFENEFPAIAYNDAQTSKSDYLTEQTLSPQHNNEYDLKDETSVFESIRYMAPLPPREQRHPFLRYQGLEYTNADIADFKERLERIYSLEIHRVQIVDFQGIPELMRDGLFARRVIEHHDDADLGGARRRLRWRQFILALGLHIEEEMESPGFSRMMAHSIVGRSHAPEKVTVTDLFYLRGDVLSLY
ncbi:hypothetical protein Tco_0987552, partial [Tanacetum coccineum]